jgi:hypothetical protein
MFDHTNRVTRVLGRAFGAALLAGCSVAANATTVNITFDHAAALDGSVLTTPIAGAAVYNFDSGMPAGYSGAGGIVSGSTGTYAAPAGDTTHYLSVALNSPSGTQVANFGQDYDYFGLYWGSIDDYNTLSFLSHSVVSAVLTGADVIAAGVLFGDRMAPGANRYVNFFFDGGTFDAVQLSSTQYAFESDNHAVARVSEPATLALMGLGLVMTGLVQRKRQTL